jgi:hypothetical protein
MINQLGCQHFATENNQILTSFYSIDKWKDTGIYQTTDKNIPKKYKNKKIDPVQTTKTISPQLQQIL